MNEYRVKITLRNNLLLTAIESAGYKFLSDFAKACDLTPSEMWNLTSLRKAPIGKNGAFIAAAQRVMEVLGCAPNDLWTDDQLYMELERNTRQKTFSKNDIKYIGSHVSPELFFNIQPEEYVHEQEKKKMVSTVLSSLTAREKRVLEARFGKEATLEEIAQSFDVQSERVRQIEGKAIRKCRDETRSVFLEDFK